MEKTIEILSVPDRGNVNLTVKGEPRKIRFENKGEVSIAPCDHDEAEVLLGLPGNDFWKEGFTVTLPTEEELRAAQQAADDELAADIAAQEAATAAATGETGETGETGLTVETFKAVTNLPTLAPMLAACQDKATITELITIEATSAKPREKWLAALNTRLTELG